MELDQAACYRALETRDARFDGRFVTAVRSTGVYCRPICPANTPRRENCQFYACAAAAHEAGFRPCLRCRPEASPGSPAWMGTSTTVSRALRLIEDGALDAGSVESLAARLGVGDRHLRRLFLRHLGATPVAVAQTRRLQFAKRLVDDTDLSFAQIALASGYSSVRRFNDAIRNTYARPPSALRRESRRRARRTTDAGVSIRLGFRPPYDWSRIAAYLELRATPRVEGVDARGYWRTVRMGEAGAVTGLVRVRPIAGEAALSATLCLPGAASLIVASERLRRMFDLSADPQEIGAHLARDPRLRPAVRSLPGLRLPGAWDGFELAVRAILGQQVTVRGATSLAGRLAEQFGTPLSLEGAAQDSPPLLFPTPETLADADVARIGLPGKRAEAIRALATAVAAGAIALDGSRDVDETRRALCALPGVGEWTAEYVAMRALGEPDAYPASDLGIRRALGDGGPPVSAARALELAERWRPWRAYAALVLWSAPTGRAHSGRRNRGASVH